MSLGYCGTFGEEIHKPHTILTAERCEPYLANRGLDTYLFVRMENHCLLFELCFSCWDKVMNLHFILCN